MPWIENIGLSDVSKGRHHAAGENSMLIQIVDPAMNFPTAMHKFKETHQFEFLDLEGPDAYGSEFKVTDEQAAELVRLLQHALEGFRSPNLLVKHKMMKVLGWTYDENEPHTINGVTLDSGLIVPAKAVEWTNKTEKVFTLATARREQRKREGDI